MAEEIKTRITIEADEAVKNVQAVSDAEKEMTGATEEGAEAGKKATEALSVKDRVVQGVGKSLMGVVSSWLAVAAVAGAIFSFFRDLAEEARKSAAAIVEVGRALRALSANVGGKEAALTFQDVTAISAESRFSVQGRAELLEGITAATDIRPGMNRAQRRELAQKLALLQRATGVGGREGFMTVQSLGANMGLSDDQAVDAAAVLLNSGLGAQAIQDISQRGGAGGMDFLALMHAARAEGLDPNKAGRAIPSLIGNLMRRDATGALDPKLARLGITDEMGAMERLQYLVAAEESGAIKTGQFFEALGGEEQGRMILPLARVLRKPGAMAASRAALTDEQAAENELRKVLENTFVQAEERQNLRDLKLRVERERSSLTPYGEELAAGANETQRLPGIIKPLWHVGNLMNYLMPPDPEQEAQRHERVIGGRSGGGAVTVNQITIGTQFNASPDGTTPFTGPDPRRQE